MSTDLQAFTRNELDLEAGSELPAREALLTIAIGGPIVIASDLLNAYVGGPIAVNVPLPGLPALPGLPGLPGLPV